MAEAHDSYPMQPIESSAGDVFRVVLASGVEAELQVPLTWPAADQQLTLLGLEAATTKVDLQPVVQQLQADTSLSRRSLMDFLQSVTASVQAALA